MLDLFSSEQDKHNTPPFDFPLDKEGYNARYDAEKDIYHLSVPNGELIYAKRFFNQKISDRSIEYFLENNTNDWKSCDWRQFDQESLSEIDFKNIRWHHDKISMFGRPSYLPRYSAWYGDNDKPYTYSGIHLIPQPWNKGLLYIKEQIEKVSTVAYNSVLMNWYRDGDDYISWHTDAERELGKNPEIASVNFGETRRFLIRRQDDHKTKLEIPLHHGTLLIMKGQLQHYWQHSVPKQKSVKTHRFNLTFRHISHD